MVQTLAVQGVIAFAAGMVLNFMPCVLPVMPFKVQALLRETNGTIRSRTLAAAALLAGSLTFFIVMGALTVGFGLMWGQQFQNPWFRLLLSLFLFAAAIATFSGWSMRLPQAIYRAPMGRHLGAFLSGALAGVLSTPCSGPFLGSVLAYAATRPPRETLILFCAIGAGLAFPYVALMIRPVLLERLSFNSRVAALFKTVLGFVLLGGSLFFGQGFLPASLVRLAWMVLVLGFGIWMVFQVAGGRRRRWRPVLVPALALIVVTAFQGFSTQAPGSGVAWLAYSDAHLEAAAGRPVLVEFSADWCINCKAMEQTTFKDERLLQTIDRLAVLPLKVDLTQVDDARRGVFDRFGGRAIPYTVVLDKHGQPVKRFTGMVGPDTLVEALQSIGG